VFTRLYKNFGITLLIFIFVQKYQVGHPVIFSFNLVRIFLKMM